MGPVTAAQSGIASHGRNCEIKEPESFIMVAILALCFTGSERQSELLLERQVEQENRELCPKKSNRSCCWIGCVGVREMAKSRMTPRFLACTLAFGITQMETLQGRYRVLLTY